MFENKKTSYFNSDSDTKAVPLMELMKELFHPTDQDNKHSTPMLEQLAPVAAKAWIDVGMTNAAAVSDMNRNGYLNRPTTNKEMISGSGRGLFHSLSEELRITAVMTAM